MVLLELAFSNYEQHADCVSASGAWGRHQGTLKQVWLYEMIYLDTTVR
jgi:hypothetical protein